MAGFLDYEDVKRVYADEVSKTGSLDSAFSAAIQHAYEVGLGHGLHRVPTDGQGVECPDYLLFLARKFYANKLSADSNGRGRVESAFYATVKRAFSWGVEGAPF